MWVISLPGDVAHHDERNERHAADEHSRQRWPQPVVRRADDDRGSQLAAVLRVQAPDPSDLEHPLAHGEHEDREQARIGAERARLAGGERDDQAAGNGHRQREEEQSGEPPAAKRGLEQQEDPEKRGERERQELQVRRRVVRRAAEDLRVVVEREADLRELALDRRLRRGGAADVDRGGDIDVARERLVLDVDRIGSDRDVRDARQWDVTAARGVDRKVANGLEVGADRRDAPDDGVEHGLLLEEVPDREAGDERRGLAPRVAGQDAGVVGLRVVDRDVDVRLHRRCRHLWLAEPVDARHQPLDLGRERVQLGVVLAIHADGDVLGRRGRARRPGCRPRTSTPRRASRARSRRCRGSR